MVYSDSLLMAGLATSLLILVGPTLAVGGYLWWAEHRERREGVERGWVEERGRPSQDQAA